jgi:ATP-binding cassette subfamily A (ABC1) protein 3
MNHGVLQCCGSPLFLKSFYGKGFRVKIFKNEAFSQSKLEALLSRHIARYQVETNVAHELCISIPFSEGQRLPAVLNTIEENKCNIGMDTYSISSSTMEEVFLKVGKIDQKFSGAETLGTSMDARNVDEKFFECKQLFQVRNNRYKQNIYSDYSDYSKSLKLLIKAAGRG